MDDSWSTRCPIDAIAPLKECMPCDAFTDLYRCLHFADDFDDDEEWSDIFFEEKHVSPRWQIIDESLVRLRMQSTDGGKIA